MSEQQPLSGIRVIDLTVIFAGPASTMLLADWGAEVIRLESFAHYPKFTRGPENPSPDFIDRMRKLRHPYYTYVDWNPGDRPWNRNAAFNAHSRNKLSVDIDVASTEGKAKLFELAKVSDVLIENNAPSFLDRLGITFEALQEANPRLIMVRMPGFGLSGPYREYKANGLNMDAISGHLSMRGYEGLLPTDQGVVVTADAVAAVYGALGTVLALLQREQTGMGQLVEAAMVEGFLSCLPIGVLEYAFAGLDPLPRGNRSKRYVPHGVFECLGQDRWVTVSVRSDEEWRRLCEQLEFTDWLNSGNLDGVVQRLAARNEIHSRIQDWTIGRSVGAVVEKLVGAVAVAAVLDEADVFQDPHIASRGMFAPMTQADCGTHLYMQSWWTSNGQRAPLRLPPPLMGEHDLNRLVGPKD